MLGDDIQKALYDDLDAMRVEELVQTAAKLGLHWDGVPKATLIEQIIAVDIDRNREKIAVDRKIAQRKEERPGLPPDPDMDGDMLLLTPQDLAIIFAALLPPDAKWTPFSNTVQTYSKGSTRFEQGNAVTFYHRSSDGHERRYRIRFPDITPLLAELLP